MREHFRQHLESVHRRCDRVFVLLLALQWALGVVLALTYSPLTWAGAAPSTHVHVYYATIVGGLVSGIPIALILTRPGWVVTRHTVAFMQMLWSALLIHLTGGRIETHFHVFGSLAFLAFYRDWGVLLTATLVVVSDHLLRGLTWPQSVYGVSSPDGWRFLEHAGWVVFEDVVLVMGISETIREMKALAARQIELETLNETFEQKVVERTEELAASREELRALLEGTRSIPFHWDSASGRFAYVGPQGAALLGSTIDDWSRVGFWQDRLHPDDRARVEARWQDPARSDHDTLELRLRHENGGYVTLQAFLERASANGSMRGFLIDVTQQRRLELELNHAQKLESVGRLASGIAHEINTPVQFVNDSIHYVRDAFTESLPLISKYQELRARAGEGVVPRALLDDVDRAELDADLGYTMENVPRALDRAVDGLARVATLVRSLKEFAHPDQKQKLTADLNHALSTTLTIARNEYKYVADVETDLGELPGVLCHVNELNQAFLNIIVNAAHAIEPVVRGTDAKGLIRVTTRREGDEVVIRISDTGQGIPEGIRSKIFEPFFTTKDVGKGTGQGLSIARNVVVDKHGGSLSFESRVGVGTTFVIRLPIGADAPEIAAVAA